MSFVVVSVDRDRYYYPKLTIVVEARVSSAAAGEQFITAQVMRLYEKRRKGKFAKFSSMRVKEFRVVDEVGLRRLQAAAKASVTIRKKRAAKRAAETRARNRAVRQRHEVG